MQPGMATPLTPSQSNTLNTIRGDDDMADGGGDSSPFQENASPMRSRPQSRIISGSELSPLKILGREGSPDLKSPPGGAVNSVASPRSPRKMVPVKRFPVKVSVDMTPRAKSPEHTRTISIDEAIRENSGLKTAIEIFEDEGSIAEVDEPADANEGKVADDDDTHTITTTRTVIHHDIEEQHETGAALDDYDDNNAPDDTMISQFSAFSAVPNLTMFNSIGGMTPRGAGAGAGPSPMRTPRAGPLPNRNSLYESGNTTNLLMDFTEQLRFPQKQASFFCAGDTLPPSHTHTHTHTHRERERERERNLC
jgi:hypothetical protein